MSSPGPVILPDTDDVDPRRAPTHLAVLGPLVVCTASGETRPRASRQRRLLTILAVNAGPWQPVTVEEMVEGLYETDASQAARRSLATELWRARQVIGAASIVTDQDGYRLDLDHCDVDVMRFQHLLTCGRAALRRGDHDRAERDLRSALERWRGTPFPDWQNSATGRAAAARLVELHAGGRVDHAEALAATGRRDEAVHLLESIVGAEPTREHAWALLIEIAAAAGDHRAARTALDTARRTLAEYGVDVGTELTAARRRIDVGAATTLTSVARGSSVSPTPSVSSVSSASASSAGAARPVLAGRADEVAALGATLRDALSAGRFRLALVSGEAGVGKTAVAESALDGLGTTSVVRVHGDRRSVLPYGPIVSALRALGADAGRDGVLGSLVHDLTDDPGIRGGPVRSRAPAAERSMLHDAIVDTVVAGAAARGGLALLVEDLQWVPASTVDVLAVLAARRPAVPLAVVITARTPAAAGAGAAQEGVAELRRHAHTTITLQGLDLSATAQLLGAGRDRAEIERLHRATGGNPLYLRHVRDLSFADTGLRVPSLDDAVDEHLATVAGGTAEVLALAAVIGTQIDVRVLTAAAARSAGPRSPVEVAEALEEAQRAGLLHRGREPGSLSWVHEVLCARLYATLPVARRAALHVQVAEASERLVGSSPVPLDLVAHHYAAGWPVCSTGVTVSRLTRAGDHAAAQLAFDAAARCYRRAVDFLGMDPVGSDPLGQVTLLEAEGNALLASAGLHDGPDGESALARARSVFATLSAAAPHGAAALRLRAAVGMARASAPHPVGESVLDAIADGVETVIAEAEDAVGADSALVGQGLGELRAYRPGRAAALLERVVAADPGSSGTLHAAAWAHQSVGERVASAQRLVQDDTADPVAAWVRLWVSEAAAGRRALDDPPPGRPGSGVGDDAAWWEVHVWEISAAIAGGRFGRAERLLAATPRWVAGGRDAAEIATRAAASAGQRLRLHLVRSPTGVLRDVERPPGIWVSSHPVLSHPVIRSWSAYLAAVTGHPDLAGQACDDLVEQHHDGMLTDADLLPWACATAVAALAAGRRRTAAFLQEVLRPHSGHFAIHTFTAYWGCVDHYLGRLALLLGEPEEAVDRLDRAVVQYRHAHARPYEARALYDLAVAHSRCGDAGRGPARAHRQQAVALLDSLAIDSAAAAPWPPTA